MNWQPITLSLKQREIVRAVYENSQVLAVGGWGFGKSVAIAYCGWLLATSWEPGTDGLFLAPTHAQLQRTLVKAFIDRVARPGHYRLIANGTNPRIEIALGHGKRTTIFLLSGEEHTAARLEGLNLSWAAIDEAQDLDKSVWDRVAGRVRIKNAKLLRRFGSGLPESGTWLEEALEVDPQPGLRWVRGKTADNEHLSPDYIDGLKKTLPPNLYKSRVLGLFAPPSGLVYSVFSREIHVRPCPFTPGVRVVIGSDFNNFPMAAVILQDVGAETRVVGEIVEPGTTAEQAQRLVRWCADHGVDHRKSAQCVVIPDASGSARQHATGKSDHQILREAGFDVSAPAANPPIRDRDNALLARLLTADGVPHLFVDPSCRRTIAALSGLKHKGRDRSEHSHAVDALGYPIHRFHALETAAMPALMRAAREAGGKPRAERATY